MSFKSSRSGRFLVKKWKFFHMHFKETKKTKHSEKLTDAFKDSTKCIADGFHSFKQAMVQMSSVLGKSFEAFA